jgi:hypothetical protein
VADVLRIVTFTDGGRPVTVLDLNDTTNMVRDRTADITFSPGPASVQYSRRARRFGGGRPVGVTHDNATLGWTAYVKDSSYAAVVARLEALMAQIESVSLGRFVQWQPEGGLSSYMELAGPGSWTPAYDPVQFAQTQSMRVALTLPCLPLVRWDPMTIGDPFDLGQGHLTDYTFDAMTAASVDNTLGSFLAAAGTLTTERRARHTARGYSFFEGEAIGVFSTGSTTITNMRAGVILRASNASNYVACYTDDNGTNSRLRIDVVVAGTTTNRASVNLGGRWALGTVAGIRGRIEGSTVFVETVSAASSYPYAASSTVVSSTSYTLTSGEQTALVAGTHGFTWTPQDTTARLRALSFSPFTRRAATLPTTFTFFPQSGQGVTMPGTAPALVDAVLTPTGGSAVPSWAQIGWADYTDAVTPQPFGLIEAEVFTLTTWATSAQAGASGGTDVRATTSGTGTFSAFRIVNLSSIAPDDFQDTSGTIDVEVWARAVLTSTLVNPRMVASFVQVVAGTVSAAGQRFTAEYGSSGKALTVPSSGTVYRPVRLGTITMNRQFAASTGSAGGAIKIDGSVDVGSAGAFGFDYVWVVPARRRALGPTGVVLDGTYPAFVTSTGTWVKRVRSDLSATIDADGVAAHVGDHGLSGSLIEVDPGTPKFWVKLSSEVPDDPTSDASSEQTTHTASVQLDVVPRSFMLRSV